MSTRNRGLPTLAGVGAAGVYASALLASAPPITEPWLACAELLTVWLGWYGGPRLGLAVGAALAALHLALASYGGAWSQWPLATSCTFGLSQLLLAGSGLGVGRLQQTLLRELDKERARERRYTLAASGSEDGLWDWDLTKSRVYRSPRWCEIVRERDGERLGDPRAALVRAHPDDAEAARAKLEAHLRGDSARYEHAYRLRRGDDSYLWVLDRGVASRDEAGAPLRMAGFLSDISAHKESEERLRHHAFHDALTGLPNRALFLDRVQHAVARARRTPISAYAVLMLDLDRFKNVNDSLGHVAGDRLLVRVAERLQSCVRDGDTVARLGGDEFSILLDDLQGEHEAERVAEQIQRALTPPIPVDGHDLVTSASIGIVVARDDTFDVLSLLRRADQAMYAAKRQGRGRQVLFEPSAHTHSNLRLTLETSLRGAISAGQLRVYYQPIVNVASGEAVGFEALVRWPHPKLGMISPAELVPVAEESGAIVQLGDFVLDEACRALRRLTLGFGPSTPFRMAVNLSARELVNQDLLTRIEGALGRHQVAAEALVLEVKESALMEAASGEEPLRRLRERGVRVHMDDFGTGYSSLSYLHKFAIDALKIDASFTMRLHENPDAEEIVRSVITIARDLRLGVIAEGVETREQLERLRALGCEEAQGFLFGAPLPLEALEALLRRGPKLAVA